MIRNNKTYYYHADALGSITRMTGQNGSTVQTIKYDSFGNIKSISNPLLIQPYAWTGREYDIESGFYYLRNRYYDPRTGRFTTKDPIGFEGGDVNVYGYVGQNPVNWVDPWGVRPGDPYPTSDAAAIDAINDINPTSISQGREYGGYIYQNSNSTYSYTPSNPGTKDSTNLGPKPSNGKITGDYHTHGATDIG